MTEQETKKEWTEEDKMVLYLCEREQEDIKKQGNKKEA